MAGALAFSTPALAASGAPTAPAAGPSISLADSFRSSTYNTSAQISDWRRCGWRGCWGRGWRRGWRGRRGIGIGGVLAGAAVIGGIAAIASANNRRRDREVIIVDRDNRVDDRRYDDRRQVNPRSSGSNGLDSAVSQCLREIERDVRVDAVDGASRVSSGWIVTGSIFNGSGFSCEIGNDGRISDIQYGGFRGGAATGSFETRADGQFSDDRYASARAAMNGETNTTYSATERFAERPSEPLVPLTADRMPAYPGGPIPGDSSSQ